MMDADPLNLQIGDARSLFNRTLARTLNVQSHIWAFHHYVVYGYPTALETTLKQTEQVAREHLMNPNFGTDEQRRPYLENLETYARGAALNTVQDALATAEASCIVFAHSMLDAAVLDYCRVSAMINAEDWSEWVEDDRFTLRQLRQTDTDGLLTEAVERFMKKLNYKSLLNKIEALQKVCQPGSAEIREDYKFDGDRIRRIDDLRIAIVHKEALGSRIPTLADDLEYLWETNLYLSGLIAHRYGLRLGPEALLFATGPASSPSSPDG
jgi:hypothetical protein